MTASLFRRVLGACGAGVFAGITAFGAQDQAPQPPTFRSGVQLVEIDVSVTDAKGEFVRGLTRDDFDIFEDGVRQTVGSFQFLDIPLDAPPVRVADESVQADVTTNTREGRMYVMLLDCCAPVFGAGPDGSSLVAPGWAVDFVERALRPEDLMAVIHVTGSISAGQPFTSNKVLLRASLNRFSNASAIGSGDPPPNPCQAAQEKVAKLKMTYDAIEQVSERLGNVNGRRKAILWLNANIPFDPVEEFGGSRPSPDGMPCDGAAMASSVSFMHRDAIRVATRNNVAIYPIDPVGLTTTLGQPDAAGPGELGRMAALRGVAEDTGGDVITGTNNYKTAYERIVRQNSTYYLLGYYPAIEHHDGKFHNVTVRVKRKELTVRAKRGYLALAGAPASAAEPPSLLEGLSPSGRGALRSPAPVRGLGIDLFAAPFKGSGQTAAVVLGADLRGSDLRLGASEQVEVSYLPIDAQGKIEKGARKVFTLNFKPETRAQIERSGLRFVDRLELPPGRHELRFAVHQPGGATGSVVAQVEVPDFSKDPLVLSGLVVGSGAASHYTLLGDEPIKAALKMDPTSVRRFAPGDQLSVLTEVYINAAKVPDDLDLTFTVETLFGDVVLSEPGWPADKSQSADGRRRAFSGEIDLLEVPPGNYVLTARAVSLDGELAAARHVPFTIASTSPTPPSPAR